MSDFQPRYLSDYSVSNFAINTVSLTFELDETATRVTNVMQITQASSTDGVLKLDGEHLALHSVALNERLLDADEYQVDENALTLKVSETDFTLTIVTIINPLENTALEGLFKSGDAYCTQCEAEGFRRISYYLDRPDVMATFTTKVIANKAKFPQLLANGNKIDAGDLEGGLHFTQWHDPFPKPCYLFALVAGDFDILQDSYKTKSGRDVCLEIFVDKGNLNKAHHAMASLKHSMAWDERTFDLEYDLDIYMIVAVDFFNMGAMENKGLNVFNSKFVLADKSSATDTDYFNIEAVIAHEYFHNWTGNRVTCRDWFQLSLKEGLTVFRDQQFSADMHSPAVTRIQNVRVLRSMQFAEDAGPMAHPIRPEKVIEMNNFYTLTVYEKGSEVIRMIHTLLGEERFKRGIDLYFERFDGMAVTCNDFVTAMSDASGIDLSLFKRWYEQSGTPVLSVEQAFDAQRGTFTLTISQNNNDKPILHIPIGIEIIDSEQQTTSHLLELKDKTQTWTFTGYQQLPVIALLTGFSAPVKTDFSQSDSDLQTVMTFAKDEFCCWDAGQTLLKRYIIKLMAEPTMLLPESLILAFENILSSDSSAAFKAEQLTLPSFDELKDSLEDVDPLSLLDAIEQLKVKLALSLEGLFIEQYQTNMQTEYEINGEAIGKRALRNTCLSFLSTIEKHQDLIKNQYQQADNMTDCLAALSNAASGAIDDFDELMEHFEQRWYQDTLVMDKWFAINAKYNSDNIYPRLAKLISHELFSLKNPNRARALIGAFVMQNPRYFHCETGQGYRFLSNQIEKLNEINPQVASRLITPLIQFKALNVSHQALIKGELNRLADLPSLSKDLKEKLDAALAS